LCVLISYSAPVGVQSIVINPSVCVCVCLFVCLSASISLELLDRSSRTFVRSSAVVVARPISGGVAIHYVLPVLWMTSNLGVMGRMALCDQPSGLAVSYVRDRGGV